MRDLNGVQNFMEKEIVIFLLDFLGQYSLTLHVREVKLTEDDENILRETH